MSPFARLVLSVFFCTSGLIVLGVVVDLHVLPTLFGVFLMQLSGYVLGMKPR